MARGHGHDRGGSAQPCNRATAHACVRAAHPRPLRRGSPQGGPGGRGAGRKAALSRPHLAACWTGRSRPWSRRRPRRARATWSTRCCGSSRSRPSTRSPGCPSGRSSTPRSRSTHRILVIYEAAGMASDGFAPYFLRTLLTEGHLRYETVETPKQGKPKGVVLEREGPTGAILTTTRVKLDPELETRLLSIPVTDSAAQTKAVMYALADEDARAGAIDLQWHAPAEGDRRRRRARWGRRSRSRARSPSDPPGGDPAAARLRGDPGADPRPRAPTPGDEGARRARTARSRRSRTTRWCGSWSPT